MEKRPLGVQHGRYRCFCWLFPCPLRSGTVPWTGCNAARPWCSGSSFTFSESPLFVRACASTSPGVSILIAPQCSGIRSSYALLVLTAALTYIALRSPWRRLLLLASVFPLVMLKNGIRIATLTLLAEHVDPSYLHGALHHEGGFVFFGIVLALEVLLCWALGISERKAGAPAV